ncbi:heme o synthase [Aquipuribacter nitratireducens]|uniref:Protoheme IX farnesyltransferase n=1 Tax=Aquipuribacter nitratireducens TaxID=650104 RepID=A0ABW0GJC7_9MICO
MTPPSRLTVPEAPPALAAAAPAPARSRLAAYVALTKPRIIELLLVTTVPTMVLAAGGLPDWRVVLATLVGGTLAAGSANTLNQVADRDIDAVMERTRHRPIVTGEVSPRAALGFGLALGVAAVALLWWGTTPLAALLAVAAVVFYAVVYTLVLKRRTSQNIVWGGAAGFMPVLIGWAAVTGSLAWAPVVLSAVIFFWTPPHYWPLSMRYRDDYARAQVPMLPVVGSARSLAWQTVAHTLAMVACTLLLVPVAGMGVVYTVTVVVAGAVFTAAVLGLARQLRTAGEVSTVVRPMRVFHLSITYLSVVFLAVAVDPFLV